MYIKKEGASMQVNLNPSVNYSRPNFKANLIMPAKEVFEKYSTKIGAEGIEIARPTIEKLAREATELQTIQIQPRFMNWQRSNKFLVSAVDKNDNPGGWTDVGFDETSAESCAKDLIHIVKELIKSSNFSDWLT